MILPIYKINTSYAKFSKMLTLFIIISGSSNYSESPHFNTGDDALLACGGCFAQAGRFTPYYIYNAPINISLRGKQGADGYWGEGETIL